jgi:UDP-xylose/UDP-N-acetylglucosamine transporter B4
VQFFFIAVIGLPSQFDRSRPPFFLKQNKVPIRRWLINIILFFSINVLNNHAFSYDISVPVHIILRSGGSITTMIAGSLYGKKYSRIQITAVLLLTVGVILAAWSDAQTKVGRASLLAGSNPLPSMLTRSQTSTNTGSEGHHESTSFTTGLGVLFIAQILSATMGLYTEETYRIYGPQWKENLFYSHLLSLPLFLPFLPSLIKQFSKLANSAPLSLSMPLPELANYPNLSPDVQKSVENIKIPSQLFYLMLNVLTQYACIRGVNLLAAASSALTVTIVLNIRKLVSLLLSIWLFGNRLAPGTLLGAMIVFFSGGLYSLGGRRKSPTRNQTPPVAKAG